MSSKPLQPKERELLPYSTPTPKQEHPMRAAIYARFSTDLQCDASIEDQLRLGRELAAKAGYEVVEVYSDRAASGASLLRPGLQALLRDARVGRFDVVIAEALDRLSRSQADTAGLHERLSYSRVSIGIRS